MGRKKKNLNKEASADVQEDKDNKVEENQMEPGTIEKQQDETQPVVSVVVESKIEATDVIH